MTLLGRTPLLREAVQRPTALLHEPLLTEGEPQSKPEEFDPHADWFKEPFKPEHSRAISQIIRSRRNPEAARRLRAAGEQGAAQVRTTTARKTAAGPSFQIDPPPGPGTVRPTGPGEARVRNAAARIRRDDPSERRTRTDLPTLKRVDEAGDLPSIRTPQMVKRRGKRKLGTGTVVLMSIPERAKAAQDAAERRPRRQKTTRLPRQEPEEKPTEAHWCRRTPLLYEFVAPPSNSTGNTFLSTTKPGTRISGAPSTGNDTGKVGLVSVQGGVVPDKEKRKIEPPKSKIPRGVWDPITKELEAQPSNTGGVLTLIRTRPKLLGG